MAVSAPVADKANGLSTVVNILTAPREAFETLRKAPTWGWAFLITTVLAMIGQYLATPATLHAVQAMWPAQVAANPALAGESPQQQQAALHMATMFIGWIWLFSPVSVLIVALIQSVVMTIFKAAGRGDAEFKQIWCASMNTLVVGLGIYSLLSGLISVLRGAASYNSTADAMRAMPSLAWIVPQASLKLVSFLAAFNVVSIWGAILLVFAMTCVAKTSRVNASACAIIITAFAGLYFAWGAH